MKRNFSNVHLYYCKKISSWRCSSLICKSLSAAMLHRFSQYDADEAIQSFLLLSNLRQNGHENPKHTQDGCEHPLYIWTAQSSQIFLSSWREHSHISTGTFVSAQILHTASFKHCSVCAMVESVLCPLSTRFHRPWRPWKNASMESYSSCLTQILIAKFTT